MKVKILLLGIFLSIMNAAAVDTVTVALQNGLDGYSGCDDSWIASQAANQNFGSDEYLNIKYEKCQS